MTGGAPVKAVREQIAFDLDGAVEFLVSGGDHGWFGDFWEPGFEEGVAAAWAVIEAYGQRLVEIPGRWWEEVVPEPVVGSDPPAWRVSQRLWTEREAPSDLVLELLVITDPGRVSGARCEVLGVRVVPFEGVRGVPPPAVPRVLERHDDRRPDPDAVPVPVRWRSVIKGLMDRLVAGELEALIAEGVVPEVERERTARELRLYRGTFVALPEEAWRLSDHDPDEGWGSEVRVPFWSVEQGPTNLTFLGVVFDDGVGSPRLEFSYVHIL